MKRGTKAAAAMLAGLALSLLPIVAEGVAEAQDRGTTLELGGVSYELVPPAGLCPLELDHASLALPVRQYFYARTAISEFDDGLGLLLWLVDCGWLREIDDMDHFRDPVFPVHMMLISVPVRPNGQLATMGSTSREAYLGKIGAAYDGIPWAASDAEALAEMERLLEAMPAGDESQRPPATFLARRAREDDVVYSADLQAYRSLPSRSDGRGETYWEISASLSAVTVLGDFPLFLKTRDVIRDSLPADRLHAGLQSVVRQLRSQDDGRP